MIAECDLGGVKHGDVGRAATKRGRCGYRTEIRPDRLLAQPADLPFPRLVRSICMLSVVFPGCFCFMQL